MSLVSEIVLTSVLSVLAVVFFIVAVVNDSNRVAWFAFAFAIIAQAAFLDVRMRWREAHRYTADGLRSIG